MKEMGDSEQDRRFGWRFLADFLAFLPSQTDNLCSLLRMITCAFVGYNFLFGEIENLGNHSDFCIRQIDNVGNRLNFTWFNTEK